MNVLISNESVSYQKFSFISTKYNERVLTVNFPLFRAIMKGLESHFDNLKKYGFTFAETNVEKLLEAGESISLDKTLFRRISKLFEELEQKRRLVSNLKFY